MGRKRTKSDPEPTTQSRSGSASGRKRPVIFKPQSGSATQEEQPVASLEPQQSTPTKSLEPQSEKVTVSDPSLSQQKGLFDILLSSEQRIPELGELARELMKKFGGTTSFAEHWFKTFKNANKSPAIQSRMMEQLTYMVQKTMEMETQLGLEDLTDDELAAAFIDLVKHEPEVVKAISQNNSGKVDT